MHARAFAGQEPRHVSLGLEQIQANLDRRWRSARSLEVRCVPSSSLHLPHVLRQILGDLVTKGSVYVLFDEGNKSKWASASASLDAVAAKIRPADLEKLLRQPGQVGPSPVGDASPSARSPDDRQRQRRLHVIHVMHGFSCSLARECSSG